MASQLDLELMMCQNMSTRKTHVLCVHVWHRPRTGWNSARFLSGTVAIPPFLREQSPFDRNIYHGQLWFLMPVHVAGGLVAVELHKS